MSLVELDISKGLYSNQPKEQTKKTPYASKLHNLFTTEAGAQVDLPGFAAFGQVLSTPFSQIPINGLYGFKNRLVAVNTSGQIYSFNETGAYNKLTTNTESTNGPLQGQLRPSFCDDGSYVYIANGEEAKRWDGSAGLVTHLGGTPPQLVDIVLLDNYLIGLLPNSQRMEFAGPAAADRAAWDSSNFFEAEGLSDEGKKLAVANRQLFCFGEESTEVFFNFGDDTTPFQRMADGFIESGVGTARFSVVKYDNTLYWFDHERRFVRLEGRTPKMISGPIAKELKNLGVVSDCWGEALELQGDFYIQWKFPNEGKGFLYNVLTSEWSTHDLGWNCIGYQKRWKRHFAGSASYGLVRELSFDTQQDMPHAGDFAETPPEFETNTIQREMRRLFTHGTGREKRSRYYRLDLERGHGSQVSSDVEPFLEMRVNDDKKGWTKFVKVGLGRIGDSEESIMVTELAGRYRTRELHMRCQAEVPFSLNGLHEFVEGLPR